MSTGRTTTVFRHTDGLSFRRLVSDYTSSQTHNGDNSSGRMLPRRGMGNREWGMGNGEWGMGIGELKNGKIYKKKNLEIGENMKHLNVTNK